MSVRDDRRALDAVRRFGTDAVAFLALESGMRHWFDAPPPEGTGACVAYWDTGTAWVAAGAPLTADAEVCRAAQRFVEAARVVGRRASFFATERALPGFVAVEIGRQPILAPSRWIDRAARTRSLREQLRRARAKGLRVRAVDAAELGPGTSLRGRVEALAADWLRRRRMEPMRFLVSVELFHAPEEHRYLLAERDHRLVAFLSAVPVPARGGWLVEDLIRSEDAPNGTSESLLAALCREVAGAGGVSLGLAPLSGHPPAWARAAGVLGTPLYDFAGLHAFKARLHPDRWDSVFLVHAAATSTAGCVIDALRAFAGGSLLRFGARTVLRHPAGAPWALAMLLCAWSAFLGLLAVTDHAAVLGFDRATLAGWVAFDVVLAFLLFRFARRPRAGGLLAATLLAAGDAAVSLAHLAGARAPAPSWHLAVRLLASAGPVAGAIALAWATLLRLRLRRSSGALPRHVAEVSG